MNGTPYQRAYDYARAYEDEAWGRASASHWARLEAIASEHQRGEYDWPRAQALLDETVRDMRAAEEPEVPQTRSYVIGLPVMVTVHPDGTVTYEVDSTEAGAAIREDDLTDLVVGEDHRERDAATVDADHTRRRLERYGY